MRTTDLRGTAIAALALLGLATSAAASSAQEPLPEADESTIGYPSVAGALSALKTKPGAVVRTQGGWTVVDDKEASAIWSFPPPGDPAYPAAVKRVVIEDRGSVSIRMSVLCEATKVACDNLVREFQSLNERVKQAFRRPPSS
jgi:hypothetical protein